MNTPYVKQYNENGQVVNPITKGNPYIHRYPGKRFRVKPVKFNNNRKGRRVRATGIFKAVPVRQLVPCNGKPSEVIRRPVLGALLRKLQLQDPERFKHGAKWVERYQTVL